MQSEARDFTHDSRSCFLVFESALLLLFSTCQFCARATKDIKRTILGSFLRITQFCGSCKKSWCWESQPFLGNIPAGNLFTSAAILYSGAFPAKFLRALSIMKCATITSNTFFRHQRDILQPVLNITWEKHQLSLFSMIKAEARQSCSCKPASKQI